MENITWFVVIGYIIYWNIDEENCEYNYNNNSNHCDIIQIKIKFLTLQKNLQIIFLKAARNSLENKP